MSNNPDLIFRVNNNLCEFSPCGNFFAIAYQTNLVIKKSGIFDTTGSYEWDNVIEVRYDSCGLLHAFPSLSNNGLHNYIPFFSVHRMGTKLSIYFVCKYKESCCSSFFHILSRMEMQISGRQRRHGKSNMVSGQQSHHHIRGL